MPGLTLAEYAAQAPLGAYRPTTAPVQQSGWNEKATPGVDLANKSEARARPATPPRRITEGLRTSAFEVPLQERDHYAKASGSKALTRARERVEQQRKLYSVLTPRSASATPRDHNTVITLPSGLRLACTSPRLDLPEAKAPTSRRRWKALVANKHPPDSDEGATPRQRRLRTQASLADESSEIAEAFVHDTFHPPSTFANTAQPPNTPHVVTLERHVSKYPDPYRSYPHDVQQVLFVYNGPDNSVPVTPSFLQRLLDKKLDAANVADAADEAEKPEGAPLSVALPTPPKFVAPAEDTQPQKVAESVKDPASPPPPPPTELAEDTAPSPPAMRAPLSPERSSSSPATCSPRSPRSPYEPISPRTIDMHPDTVEPPLRPAPASRLPPLLKALRDRAEALEQSVSMRLSVRFAEPMDDNGAAPASARPQSEQAQLEHQPSDGTWPSLSDPSERRRVHRPSAARLGARR